MGVLKRHLYDSQIARHQTEHILLKLLHFYTHAKSASLLYMHVLAAKEIAFVRRGVCISSKGSVKFRSICAAIEN